MAAPRSPVAVAADWLLIVVMTLMVGVPAAVLFYTIAGVDGWGILGWRAEQKELGRKGKIKDGLKVFARDHFGFRDEMIAAASQAQVFGLGVSSSPRVMLGQDGWCFINEPANTPNEIRGIDPLSDKQLADILHTHRVYADWFEARGIPFLILVAPSKPDFYPEYLPKWLNHAAGQRRVDQFFAAVAEQDPTLPVIDLRPPVHAAKARGEQVFQKTDTHWTDHGAFAAYEYIMPQVAELLPSVRILKRDQLKEWVETRDPLRGGDLAAFMGVSREMIEHPIRLTPIDRRGAEPIDEHKQRYRMEGGTGEEGLPTLLMYRDSFAHRLSPYLSESFSEITYLWPSANGLPQNGLDFAMIEAEKPDMVIIEWTERWLTINPGELGILPKPFEAGQP